ncbi:MAG TPA: hypothetical protein VKG62_08960 [Solirubrobacteraceae bacterium]|nr:hypothetical protein [Solirubrobacteraceae bacterium]
MAARLRTCALVAVAVGLSACGSSTSAPAQTKAPASTPAVATAAAGTPTATAPAQTQTVATAATCPSPETLAVSAHQLQGAEKRYATEQRGTTIHLDLERIAHDPVLISALQSGNLHAALQEANALTFGEPTRHVVRIRITRNGRIIVDANPSSFSVGGSSLPLYGAHGKYLGQLTITVQDVIGFIKLVQKLLGAEVLVRAADGKVATSLPAAAHAKLPDTGCVQIAGSTYYVRSFHTTDFTGSLLTIWTLTPA